MKVVNLVGKARANTIFSRGIHLLSAGSSDFIQNYYINPLLNRAYTPDQFSDILMQSFSAFVQVNNRLTRTFADLHMSTLVSTENQLVSDFT